MVERDTSRPADKRLRVVVAQLREMFSYPGTKLQWIDNSMMLADSLTKLGAERLYLLQSVESNTWSDRITEEAVRAKERIRAQRHLRAENERAAKKARSTR